MNSVRDSFIIILTTSSTLSDSASECYCGAAGRTGGFCVIVDALVGWEKMALQAELGCQS